MIEKKTEKMIQNKHYYFCNQQPSLKFFKAQRSGHERDMR